MSKNFDEGLAVGFLLGKKQGGGGGPCPPCPPCECFGIQQPVAGFVDGRTPTKSETVETPTTEYSYVVSDI